MPLLIRSLLSLHTEDFRAGMRVAIVRGRDKKSHGGNPGLIPVECGGGCVTGGVSSSATSVRSTHVGQSVRNRFKSDDGECLQPLCGKVDDEDRSSCLQPLQGRRRTQGTVFGGRAGGRWPRRDDTRHEGSELLENRKRGLSSAASNDLTIPQIR
jgi:hypothetical protein